MALLKPPGETIPSLVNVPPPSPIVVPGMNTPKSTAVDVEL